MQQSRKNRKTSPVWSPFHFIVKWKIARGLEILFLSFDQVASSASRISVEYPASLCADPQAIPSGYRRQYNLIEVDETNFKVTIHVREWFTNTSFTSAKLQEFGGKSWYEMDLPLLQEISQRSKKVLYEISPSIEKAELYMREKKYNEALGLLKELPHDIPIVNRLLTECLYELGSWDDLIRLIQKPKNPNELGFFVDALCRKEKFDSADQAISEYKGDTPSYDRGFIEALEKRVKAEKRIAIRREQ